MTKITVTMASLDQTAVEHAYEAVLDATEDTGVEIDKTEWGPTDLHDARNLLVGNAVENPTTLWLQSIPDDTLWDLHGEGCRRIVENIDHWPKLHGRSVTLTLRYGSEIKDILMQVSYPGKVAVAMKTENAPPAVIHSAPFSYNPFNDYYTEVYREYPDP